MLYEHRSELGVEMVRLLKLLLQALAPLRSAGARPPLLINRRHVYLPPAERLLAPGALESVRRWTPLWGNPLYNIHRELTDVQTREPDFDGFRLRAKMLGKTDASGLQLCSAGMLEKVAVYFVFRLFQLDQSARREVGRALGRRREVEGMQEEEEDDCRRTAGYRFFLIDYDRGKLAASASFFMQAQNKRLSKYSPRSASAHAVAQTIFSFSVKQRMVNAIRPFPKTYLSPTHAYQAASAQREDIRRLLFEFGVALL